MPYEIATALIAWVTLLIYPRWRVLGISLALFVVVAAAHAWLEAGDLVGFALVEVVPALAMAFLAIGALIVWIRKFARRVEAEFNE